MADLRCYLTTAGIAAENNAKQFGTTLKITEMVFDGSYLADEENPENLTQVINPVLTVPCSSTLSDDEQTLTFKGSILVEQGGFNVWGIGLKTDNGVLYGYARSKGDKILTEDEGATESVRYAVDIITKNSEVVEINVNPSTVYADLEDVDNAVKAGIEEHEAKLDPHPQATEDIRGIAKVITEEQVDEGTDDSSILTIKKFTRALSASYVINTLVEKLWLGIAKRICPVGVPLPWGSDVAPDGFAIHKGQAFDIVANPELAKLYPDGIIPDMRGLGIIGKEDGELILAYEEGQVKEHGHPNSIVSSVNLGTKTTNTDSHTHTYQQFKGGGTQYYFNGGGTYINNQSATTSSDTHSHTVAIGSHAHSVAIALFGALKNTINHRKFNWIVRLA